MADRYILGIETSCDETSAAVVKNGRVVCSNVIASQIDVHKEYGGVVPEIASRKHMEAMSSVVDLAMEQSGLSFENLDAVAVTYGPGLVGALLVGLSYAKGLAYAINKPLIGVHHIEGHICANYLNEEGTDESFEPPFLCLIVSGGHTTLAHVPEMGAYHILGQTRDDAAGEAFDKVARSLGLGYPGGPQIDALAKKGNANALEFPRAFLEEGSLDFSFSGIKSAVLNALNKAAMMGQSWPVEDVAASFQKAVVDVLVTKTMAACTRLGMNRVAMAGGVCCNSALRNAMAAACAEKGYQLHVPQPIFCTDNAAMICACAHHRLLHGRFDDWSLNAVPYLPLGSKA